MHFYIRTKLRYLQVAVNGMVNTKSRVDDLFLVWRVGVVAEIAAISGKLKNKVLLIINYLQGVY